MPFGIIGRTGPGMRQVVGFRDRSTGRGTFGGEFGVRHCNQWGFYGVSVRQRRDAALFPNYFGQTCYYYDNYYESSGWCGVYCAAVDVSQCTVSGRGVQPVGVRVNDIAVFHVSTLNAGQGDLEVTVSRSQGALEEPVKVVKVCI